MKITPLKETIKTRLQERYPGTDPDDFFTKYGARPFGSDNDTECFVIINDDQSITIALSTQTHPDDAQEIRNGVTITYQSWNDYLCQPDESPVITYDTEKTVTDIDQVIPTIEALYEKINCLRFDL